MRVVDRSGMRRPSPDISAPLLLCLFITPCPAQGGPGPALEACWKRFEAAAFDQDKAQDQAAIEVLDALAPRLRRLAKRRRAIVARRLGQYLKSPHLRRGPKQAAVYEALVSLLGGLGKPAAGTLQAVFEAKRFAGATFHKEWLDLRARMLEELGQLEDPRGVRRFLLEVAVRDPDIQLQAAAGRALRHYRGASLALRKDIFKLLIRAYGAVHSRAHASLDPRDLSLAAARKHLAAISDPFNQTLEVLSGQRLRTAPQWQEFYNEHKGADWDKL